jgi:RNA polymerase sigma-70 factor (ECF subfamily)
VTTAAPTAPRVDPADLERYRRELTGYCYRMLGSGFEAEDAVQETMLRALKAADRFEGRSSLRSWLYRIATNICLDMLRGRQRRARPMELGGAYPPDVSALEPMLPEHMWVSPIADDRVLPVEADPAELIAAKESIRLAFVTALQHLPAKQRAALILFEVLAWQAAEVAELLETSVAAVNSLLQRARATLATVQAENARPDDVGTDQKELLAKFCDAFERYDMAAIVALLHEDAIQSMPPYAMWLSGPQDIVTWWAGPGIDCKGSKLIPVEVNGGHGFAQYRLNKTDGSYYPWALQYLEVSGDKIAGYHAFLEPTRLFEMFGLPPYLPPAS